MDQACRRYSFGMLDRAVERPHGRHNVILLFRPHIVDHSRQFTMRHLPPGGYENDTWEFDALGLISERTANINDHVIYEYDGKLAWPNSPRPLGYAGLSQLGF
jgi:hypothetical protein